MNATIIGFIAVLVLALAGLPIGFGLFAVGLIGFAYVIDWAPALAMVGQIAWETPQNYGFSVLPLFILMGAFLNQAKLSNDLYEASNTFLGHHRGGLAMATIVACGGFSAVCGSSLATAATMAKVSIPSMRRYGYADSLAAGSVAAGGTLGILIPPSTVFVIYGILTQTDIGKLFAAGILPGILTIVLYCLAIMLVVRLKPSLGPPGEYSRWSLRWKALLRVWAVVVLFVVVIGGLYVGAFTPTEAAGIGAFGSYLFVLLRNGWSWHGLRAAALETARSTAAIFVVLIGAIVFSNFVNVAGMSVALGGWVRGLDMSPTAVLVVILIFYVLLGCVFESMSMILLTIPILFPIVQQLGIDPIWFGVLVVVVTEVGLITPPVGLNVYVLKSVFRDIESATIFRGVFPFVCADLVRIALLTTFPAISLWLPSFMK
ncbi:MAG TPA: TRAP transporter large permease [Burkholderiales bacterium]